MSVSRKTSASGASTPRMIDLPPPPPTQTLHEHARFVLAAEFDIDSGATIRHQFPYPVTPAGSHFLAELMLPDGAHLHENDTTVFYLNQVEGNMVSDGILSESEDDPSSEEGHSAFSPIDRKQSSDKEVLYVLNCVSLKENQAVRRGAEVKALAVCFPHPFIQAYKPLLILALQRYFASPSLDVLSDLFDSINSIDTSSMPRFSKWEKWVLRASDRKDLFLEVFKDPKWKGVEPASSIAEEEGESPGTELDLGKVINPGTLSTSSSHSSLSLASPPPPTPPPKGPPPSLDIFPDSNRLRGRIASTASYKHPQGAGHVNGDDKRPKDTHVFETRANLEGTSLPMSIPLTTFHEEVGEFSLRELIRKFTPSPLPPFPGPFIPSLHTSGASTHPVILLLNALLTSRRVLFLGHTKAAGDVAAYVLAACALVSGSGAVLRGFAKKAFPYTNLMGLDVVLTPAESAGQGWVAGVTNPRFEDLTASWDVLCNIDTGRITVSKECRGEREPVVRSGGSLEEGKASELSLAKSSGTDGELGEFGGLEGQALTGGTVGRKGGRSDSMGAGKGGSGWSAGVEQDAVFMEEIISLIDRHYGESIIRTRMADYVLQFVRLTARYEEEVYPSASNSRIWYPAAPCDVVRGRLGSGAILAEGEPMLGDLVVGTGGGDKKRRESDAASALSETKRTVSEWLGPAGVKRIEAWRGTDSYQLWKEDFANFRRTTTLRFDLAHQLARLRSSKAVLDREVELIFQTLATEVRTYEQVVEVLAHTPMNRGGLTPLAVGLFHTNNEVKAATVDFFDTLQQFSIGVIFLTSLNSFHRLAYKRLADERTEAVKAQIDQSRRSNGHSQNGLTPVASYQPEKGVGLGMQGAGV